VVPTSRAGGHGGEAGTGSWERTRPTASGGGNASHKVVNTIKMGSPWLAAPFFWAGTMRRSGGWPPCAMVGTSGSSPTYSRVGAPTKKPRLGSPGWPFRGIVTTPKPPSVGSPRRAAELQVSTWPRTLPSLCGESPTLLASIRNQKTSGSPRDNTRTNRFKSRIRTTTPQSNAGARRRLIGRSSACVAGNGSICRAAVFGLDQGEEPGQSGDANKGHDTRAIQGWLGHR
jgi:hypothetical protein